MSAMVFFLGIQYQRKGLGIVGRTASTFGA